MQNTAELGPKKYPNHMANKFFDKKYAVEYDQWKTSPFLAHLEKMQKYLVLRILKINKNDKILDVGCGTGKHILNMLPKGASVIGADYSKDMIRALKTKFEKIKIKIKLVIADAMYLPFKDESFTKAITMNTLQYLVDDVKAISEINRVITDKAVLDGINITELRMAYSQITIVNSVRNYIGKRPVGIYKNYYTVDSFRKKIMKAGMQPIEIYGCGVTLPTFSKDVFKVTIPSPFHILQVFPYPYKLIEIVEKKFGNKFPVKYLGTHIIAEAAKI